MYTICSKMSLDEIFEKALDQETKLKYPFLVDMVNTIRGDLEVEYEIDTYDDLQEYFEDNVAGFDNFDWDDEDEEVDSDDREELMQVFEDYNQYLKKDNTIYIVEFTSQSSWEDDFIISLNKIDGVTVFE